MHTCPSKWAANIAPDGSMCVCHPKCYRRAAAIPSHIPQITEHPLMPRRAAASLASASVRRPLQKDWCGSAPTLVPMSHLLGLARSCCSKCWCRAAAASCCLCPSRAAASPSKLNSLLVPGRSLKRSLLRCRPSSTCSSLGVAGCRTKGKQSAEAACRLLQGCAAWHTPSLGMANGMANGRKACCSLEDSRLLPCSLC